MKNSFDEKILEEANDWIKANQTVVLATVIQTWGSSPRQVGSRMIVNNKGDFSGSVSGGCVESAVVRECLDLLKNKKLYKKIEFKVSDKSAWEIGLACGGEIAIFLERVSVVIIERANSLPPLFESDIFPIFCLTKAMGSSTPIKPVLHISTSSDVTPICSAANLVISSASLIP